MYTSIFYGGETVIKNLDSIHECKRRLIETACWHIDKYSFVQSMIIFGSSTREDCTDDSDVDICLDVEIDAKTLEYYEMSSKLKDIFEGDCDVLIKSKLSGKIKDEIMNKGVVVYVRTEPVNDTIVGEKLSLYQILQSDREQICIEHQEYGRWIDQSDGVFTIYDINQLYLVYADMWLDCEEYDKTWVAYHIIDVEKKE